MSMFTLAISCLITSNLPWFTDVTFQVPLQYCPLQHQTLLPLPFTSIIGHCFCFCSASSFFLKLFLHSSPVVYWACTDLGSLSSSVMRKAKREKERYIHLNAEFQRIARRDKKAFLRWSMQRIGRNNRMRMTRDLFKKIRDTKGAFHAKMGSIKDRTGMGLTETEEFKKNWQEYTEELFLKNILMTQITTIVWSLT